MTMTHLSHFDLTLLAETSTNVVFSGSLAACKRMAFAHGMEVEKYEGYIVSCDPIGATYTPASPTAFSRILLKPSGMIQRCQDDFTLVMPLEAWRDS